MDFVFGIPMITLILTAPGQFCEQKKEKIKDWLSTNHAQCNSRSD